MVAPNRQCVVRGHTIVVTLQDGRLEVSIEIRVPQGKAGGLHPPRLVSIAPFLQGGLSEVAALEAVRDLVALGLGGYEMGNG